MQKHITPTLAQTQTRNALNLCKQFYADKAEISQDERRAQAERERRSIFRKLAAGVLADLGFKLR